MIGRTYAQPLLQALLLGERFEPPRALHAGLLLEDGSEVEAPEYRRVPVSFTANRDGTVTNAEDLLWPRAERDWGRITEVAIFDARTGGNVVVTEPVNQAAEARELFTGRIRAGRFRARME